MTAPDMKQLRVTVLGAGKMGSILLEAFLASGLLSRDRITATVQHPERAAALAARLGIIAGTTRQLRAKLI